MLEIRGTIKKDCKIGTDVTAQRENGYEIVTTQRGDEQRPKYTRIYLEGEPFGHIANIIAPIDLRAGDVLVLEGKEHYPIRVERGDSVVWESEGMEEDE
jgi:hypothetical protein